MSCNSAMLPLLLERVGVRRLKSSIYIPPHPSLLPQGRRRIHLFIYLCPEGEGVRVLLSQWHWTLAALMRLKRPEISRQVGR